MITTRANAPGAPLGRSSALDPPGSLSPEGASAAINVRASGWLLPLAPRRARRAKNWGRSSEAGARYATAQVVALTDRKSTRLNSSHDQISYAVFCLKKKKKYETERPPL